MRVFSVFFDHNRSGSLHAAVVGINNARSVTAQCYFASLSVQIYCIEVFLNFLKEFASLSKLEVS